MSDPIGIRRGIRNTRRAAEVIAVLAKHGFRQILSDTGIERIIELKLNKEEQDMSLKRDYKDAFELD